MEQITQWATAICIVAVACSLIEMLAPSSEASKMMNFVLGLFLIVAVLLPVANSLKSGDFSFDKINLIQKNTDLPKCTDDLTINVGKTSIENLIKEALRKEKIGYKKITVNMDSSTGESIDIIRAEILVDKSYRNKLIQVQDVVEKNTGIKPDVYVG